MFSLILSDPATDYFLYNDNHNLTFAEIYTKIKTTFDTEVNKAQYHTNWSLMTYSTLKAKKNNIKKSNLEVLQVLLDKSQLYQQALGLDYKGKNQLIPTIQRAFHGISKLKFAFFTLVTTFEELSSKFQFSIITKDNCNTTNIHYFTDCLFGQNNYGDQ